jgi:hypothetical protein
MAKNWKCFEKFFTFNKFLDLGRLPVRIRPSEKSLYFVTHHNETLWVLTWADRPWELGHPKNLCIFPPFYFFTWVSHPSQWDHIWKILVFFKKKEKERKRNLSLYFIIEHVAWNNETTREIIFVFYSSSYRAGLLEQLDYSRNPSRFFFLSGRSSRTIRALVKSFSRVLLYRPGRLEQLDYLRKSFVFLLPIS